VADMTPTEAALVDAEERLWREIKKYCDAREHMPVFAAMNAVTAAAVANRDAVLAASTPPLELKPYDEAHLREWAKKDPEQFNGVKSIASLLVEWDFARALVGKAREELTTMTSKLLMQHAIETILTELWPDWRTQDRDMYAEGAFKLQVFLHEYHQLAVHAASLRRKIEFALPSLPTTGRELTLEEMSAIKLRWSFGPEKYQNDADALIGAVIALRARAEQFRNALAHLLTMDDGSASDADILGGVEPFIASVRAVASRAEKAESALIAEREKYEVMKKAFDAEDNATVLFADAKVEKARRERIVAVAVKHSTGVVLTLPAPNRHHNVLHVMSALDIYKTDEARHEQGFITSTGRFVGREEAEQIAEAAGQILRKTPGRGLFSEDVW